MPEVIEIISSPEAIKSTKQRAGFSILSSDDFSTFFFLFFVVEWISTRPFKRRRNAPNRPAPSDRIEGPSDGNAVTILSDDEPLPQPDQILVSTKSQATFTELSLDAAFSDEIVFTSSAPEARSTKKVTTASSRVQQDKNQPEYQDDEIFSFSQPSDTRKHLSERTANLLSNITSRTTIPATSYNNKMAFHHTSTTIAQKGAGRAKVVSKDRLEFLDDILDSSPPSVEASSRKTFMEKEAKAAARAEERAASKAAKEAAKQEEKKQKQRAKEQKAREKQLAADIAEVNKAKWDKKISTPEMILELPRSFEGSSICNQSLEYMKRHEVETRMFDSHISPGNVIKWRRKVKAEYDEEEGQWRPIPQRIEDEGHILCHLPAVDFVEIAVASTTISGNGDIGVHVSSLKSRFPGCKLIYLIEGLTAWMRKNRNNRNKAYQDAVRGQGASAEDHQPSRKRKNVPAAYIDEDAIEDALLELQVGHDCLIYQVTCPAESAEWIKNFTEHISTIPYRQERMNAQSDAAFCMDVGQVKTGDNPSDTYVRMLQEVNRLTPAMAYGIAHLYPDVQRLVTAFKKHGPSMLEDVKKSANKDGGMTEARLGPAISKRLYKVFLSTNPSSTDV